MREIDKELAEMSEILARVNDENVGGKVEHEVEQQVEQKRPCTRSRGKVEEYEWVMPKVL